MKKLVLLVLALIMMMTSIAIAEDVATAAEGTLQVGVGKAIVNPITEGMYGENYFGVPYTGVYGDLYVRSMAIKNADDTVLMMSFEGGISDYQGYKEMLSEATGIPVEFIMLTSTHNHTDPDGDEYTEYVKQQAVAAAKQAVGSLQPAKYAYVEGKSYINTNRDKQQEEGYWMQETNLAGYSDKTLAMIKFVDMNDKLIGVFMNYPMHNTVGFVGKAADGTAKYSGNISGAACCFIENRYEGAVALWTSGAAGNQNPLMTECPVMHYNDNEYPEMTYFPDGTTQMLIDLFGQQHALDAIAVLEKTECTKTQMPITYLYGSVDLPAQKMPEGADKNKNRLLADNLVRLATGVEEIPERKLITMLDDPDRKVNLKLQLLVLGDVALVGAGAELYCQIGRDMKEASLFKNTVVVEFTDKSVGYILDKSSAGHDVFQSFGNVKPGSADDLIVGGMLDLMEEYFETRQ